MPSEAGTPTEALHVTPLDPHPLDEAALPDEHPTLQEMDPVPHEDDGVDQTALGETEDGVPHAPLGTEAEPTPEPLDEHAASETNWRARDPDLSDWLRSASSAPPGVPPPAAPPDVPETPQAVEPPVLRPPWFSNAPAAYADEADDEVPVDEPDDLDSFEAPSVAPVESPTADVPPAEAPAAQANVPSSGEAPDDGEPLWKRMMSPGAAEPVAAPEPLWKRFVPHAAPPPDADLPRPPVAPPRPRLPGPAAQPEPAQPELARLETRALGGAPDAARRAGFVAELFDGSEAEYAATLARLADAPSLAAVTDVFQTDVLKRHRVNVYSEAATAFAAAAESRFRPAR